PMSVPLPHPGLPVSRVKVSSGSGSATANVNATVSPSAADDGPDTVTAGASLTAVTLTVTVASAQRSPVQTSYVNASVPKASALGVYRMASPTIVAVPEAGPVAISTLPEPMSLSMSASFERRT